MDDMKATPQPKAAQRIESDGPNGVGLTEWETLDPAALASGEPVQRGYIYDDSEAEGYLTGVWDCTAFDDAPGPYPVDEYMLLLEGTVTMAMPDGTHVTVNAGDAFVIPKGLDCQWKMPGYVRKIFMIVDHDGAAGSQNPSLSRVSVPNLRTAVAKSDAVAHEVIDFANANGRMQVVRRGYVAAYRGPIASSMCRLVTVLAGEVCIDGEAYGAHETFYVRPDADTAWDIAAGTQLIEARYLKAA